METIQDDSNTDNLISSQSIKPIKRNEQIKYAVTGFQCNRNPGLQGE